jgi:hypothetical protein
MRIHEILLWNDDPAEGNRSDPQLDLPRPQFSDDLTNLATAFTRSGLVKHLWNLSGSGSQPSEPAPPNPEPEVIPHGTLEPTAASWQAGPVEAEPPDGLHRVVPFRQYRGA